MSSQPRRAAACNAVRPVRGEASFASSNGSTSSARTALLNSVWTRLRSPEAAAAWSASSWAGDGWCLEGTGEGALTCTEGPGAAVGGGGGETGRGEGDTRTCWSSCFGVGGCSSRGLYSKVAWDSYSNAVSDSFSNVISDSVSNDVSNSFSCAVRGSYWNAVASSCESSASAADVLASVPG